MEMDLTNIREKMDSYRRIMERAGASYLPDKDAEEIIRKNEKKVRRVYDILQPLDTGVKII